MPGQEKHKICIYSKLVQQHTEYHISLQGVFAKNERGIGLCSPYRPKSDL